MDLNDSGMTIMVYSIRIVQIAAKIPNQPDMTIPSSNARTKWRYGLVPRKDHRTEWYGMEWWIFRQATLDYRR